MNKILKTSLNIGLVLFFLLIFSAEARAEVSAPKIIKLTAQEQIFLTGTAPTQSEVLIYLDGVFIGRSEVSSCLSSAAPTELCQPDWNFQSNVSQKLADGIHTVMAVAQDKTSLVLSAPTAEIKFTVNSLPAPTLVAPNEKTVTADLKPLITGLTRDGSSVKIFIDGVYNGETGILKDNSGTANFAYRPVFDLSRGSHKIYALARDGLGNISPESAVLNFKIELPFPAPTIFTPVVNRQTSLNRPFIVGLAKNDSKIKIYIDKKYQGELTVKNHLSGTANFAFKPLGGLARGSHSVYAVAVDKRGKISIWSKTINFLTKSSAIAQAVEEERTEAVAKIKEPAKPAEIKPKPVVISESSGAVIENAAPEPAASTTDPILVEQKPELTDPGLKEREEAIKQELINKEKAALEKITSLIGAGAEEAVDKSGRGMVNEGRESQGRLKLSIVIFILFLVGVVAWLLWVNRELVKERRAQTEAEENKKNSPDQNNKLF